MMKKTILLAITLCLTGILRAQNTEEQKRLVPVISKKSNTEFSPTISADGRTLIYETQNDEKWELFESQLGDNGEWSEPVALKSINEKCNFIAGPSLSYDGNMLYYTAFIEGVTESEDIFYSSRVSKNEWSEPRSLGAPINSPEEYEGFPSISSDGNSLYFIRVNPENDYNKKAKEPCFKIFLSQKMNNGVWGEPVPLPGEVNSGCERDPRIMADNHTLIFSSIRDVGMGKYDLYQTRKKPDGSWEPAVPLNFVNSLENDQSPCISASGSTMYYYSNNDIYQIPIPAEYRQMINITVKGFILSADNKEPLESRIYVENIQTGEKFNSNSNASDGTYSLVLAAGQAYKVSFSHPQYLLYTKVLDYSKQQTYLEEKHDVTLDRDWKFSITTEDKDLHERVSAFFQLIENNDRVVFSDSVKVNAMPVNFNLRAGNEYRVGIYGPGYKPHEKTITPPTDSSRHIMVTELLEHEKVNVSADVTDISTGGKKRMKVTYKNEDKDEVIIADAGEVVSLRKGDRYQIITESDKGYAYAMKSIVAGEGTSEGNTFSVPVPVTSLQIGAKLTLNHIYFETDSWKLNLLSASELSSIIELLQRNPNLTIEISAHTDDVGQEEYNVDLSYKRAMSVITYLRDHGIALTQLVAKGYGKSRPLVENTTEENRAKNRRVELLVLNIE